MLNIHNKITERELWIKFKNGDKESFKEIYYRYYMPLYNYGIRTSSENYLVEDCLQDLFLKLWKNRETLGEVISIKAYLYCSYTRLLYDALKKSRRLIDVKEFDMEIEISSTEQNMINNQSKIECKNQINKALNLLSKRHRQVLQLHYLDGLSYKQMEELLPIKYQAIRNYVHEALKIIREKNVFPKKI